MESNQTSGDRPLQASKQRVMEPTTGVIVEKTFPRSIEEFIETKGQC